MKTTQALSEREAAIKGLFRQYRFIGEATPGDIQRAYEQHGAPFMFKLLAIMNDGQPQSSFSNFTPGYNFVTTTPPPNAAAPVQPGAGGGKFYTWLNSILGAVTQTGQAVGSFKKDVFSPLPQGGPQPPAPQPSGPRYSQYILIALAALLVILFVVLILRKK